VIMFGVGHLNQRAMVNVPWKASKKVGWRNLSRASRENTSLSDI
jgi:hypothetical protein